jgi:hypothetical protein
MQRSNYSDKTEYTAMPVPNPLGLIELLRSSIMLFLLIGLHVQIACLFEDNILCCTRVVRLKPSKSLAIGLR